MIFIPLTDPPITSVTLATPITTEELKTESSESNFRHYKVLPDLTIEGLDDDVIPEGCYPINAEELKRRCMEAWSYQNSCLNLTKN